MIEQGTHNNKWISIDEAWLYCTCSFENGYSDWRLPTQNEHANSKYDIWGWTSFWLSKDNVGQLNVVYPVRDL